MINLNKNILSVIVNLLGEIKNFLKINIKRFSLRFFTLKNLKKAIVISIYLLTIPFLLNVSPMIGELFLPAGKVHRKLAQNMVNEKNSKQLTTVIASLEKRIERLTPGNAYLIVNTTTNKFQLYKNKKLIREGSCSTGSYVSLEAEDNKKWVFKTPRGSYHIQGKITDPVWRKPDWAFVEEGLPIPPANHPSRYEYGVLGDYALAIGNGYLIHGTLYQRFIGLPVTHGCIRMGDADLKVVYDTLPIGAKVFIY